MQTAPASKPIVFSGIQPTGQLHLGNYLGAIRHWVHGLEQRDNIFCVVDLHAITVHQDPVELASAIRQVVALLIACGLDPVHCLLYVQSHVAAHAELAWILTCITPVGWLTRMPQFKVKSAAQESVGTGLLAYPVLQAADVLLFQTDVVPTGEDQRVHIELARDIAARFNGLYGELFKLPRSEVPPVAARIMGIDDPSVKMSKSLLKANPRHGIGLLDDPDRIRNTFKKAVTDSAGVIEFSDEPDRAGVNNLLTIYQACTGKTAEAVLADFATARGYGDLKTAVAEVTIETLRPIQARYAQLAADPGHLDRLMHDAGERAAQRCAPVIRAAREAVGIRRG